MKKLIFIMTLLLVTPIWADFTEAADTEERSVVVATASMSMGHIITANDVRMSMTTRKDNNAATSLEDVIGLQVKRPIGKMNIVKLRSLKVRPLIAKGEQILLLAQKAGLKVSAKGVAREDGAVGSVIKVENVNSGKVINAEIVGPSMALVRF